MSHKSIGSNRLAVTNLRLLTSSCPITRRSLLRQYIIIMILYIHYIYNIMRIAYYYSFKLHFNIIITSRGGGDVHNIIIFNTYITATARLPVRRPRTSVHTYTCNHNIGPGSAISQRTLATTVYITGVSVIICVVSFLFYLYTALHA